VCREGILPNEFPVVGKDDQDPDGGIDELRALDEVAVQDSQDATAAYNPGPSRKRFRSCSHPPEQRPPWLLLHREEDEDVAYVDTFVRRTVVLWLQIRSKPHEHRSLGQRVWPDPVLDMEGV
jgi:hypothetical protein